MKTITIGFSKPKNRFFPFMSYLIRWYLGVQYSHVYLKFYSQSLDRWLVYEAVGGGVRFVGLSLWSKKAEEVKQFSIDIADSDYTRALQFCVDNAGDTYGTMQNLGIFFADLFNLKENPFKSGKICSEVIAEIMNNNGYAVSKQLDLITPKDLYLALDK